MVVAGDLCHRISFKASVVGPRTTVHRCLLVAIQLGLSPFVAVILLSCANQCFPSLTDGQQQGTEPVSCCGLRARCMQ